MKNNKDARSKKSVSKVEDNMQKRKRTQAQAMGQESKRLNADIESNNISNLEDKRKYAKKIKNRKRFIVVILLVIASLLLPSFVRNMSGKSPNTIILKTGSIENSINTKALVIRDEVVISSKIAGTTVQHYKNGDKVSKDSVVATVVTSDSQKLLDEIKAIELRIMQAKEEVAKQSSFFEDDIKRIDNEINSVVNNIAKASATGNIFQCTQYEKDIDILLQKKSDIVSSSGDQNEFLKQLEEKKSSLQTSVDEDVDEIVNSESGIISYHVDGYEEILNSEYVDSLTSDELSKQFEKIEKNPVDSSNKNNSVKIINGLYYYFACNVDTKIVEDIKEGKDIDVRINNNGKLLDMTVADIKKNGDTSLLLLKSNIDMGSVSSLRLVDVDVIFDESEGLKVPNKSLVDYNNIDKTASIACLKYNYVRFVQVEVVGMNKDYAIIKNVEDDSEYDLVFNDLIITNPNDFEEGQLV